MELRHLRYFAALASTMNFTRAAQLVHVSQSTLSHQIAQLEAELGQSLFERGSRKLTLTEKGETFLAHAVRALAEMDAATAAMSAARPGHVGEVRIGATPTYGLSFVPACVERFQQSHPATKIVVDEVGGKQVADGVAADLYDFGVCHDPDLMNGALRFEPLFTENLVLAVNSAHPLARRKRVRPIELHGLRMALPPPAFSTRLLIDRLLQDAGAVPTVVIEFSSIAATIALVERTSVAAILSEHVLAGNRRIAMLPIAAPTAVRTPGILWRRDAVQSTAVNGFADALRSLDVRSRREARRAPARE